MYQPPECMFCGMKLRKATAEENEAVARAEKEFGKDSAEYHKAVMARQEATSLLGVGQKNICMKCARQLWEAFRQAGCLAEVM